MVCRVHWSSGSHSTFGVLDLIYTSALQYTCTVQLIVHICANQKFTCVCIHIYVFMCIVYGIDVHAVVIACTIACSLVQAQLHIYCATQCNLHQINKCIHVAMRVCESTYKNVHILCM